MHDKKPSPVGDVPSAHTGADEGRAEGLGAVALESSSHRLTAMPAPFDKGASLSPLRGFGGTPEFQIGAEGAGVKREQ